MNDGPEGFAVGARTWSPRSPSCWAPILLILVVMALVWFSFRAVVARTGDWAIEAARHGIGASGLPEERAAPFLAQVQRLDDARGAESLEAPDVVNGVALLLDSAMVPLLVLDDVRTRRIDASGLSDEERAAADETLSRIGRLVDGGAMGQEPLIEILGELTEVPDSGALVPLDDDGLRALAARARDQIEALEAERAEQSTQLKYRIGPGLPNEAEITPTHARLLIRFREHVDATLAGNAPKVER